MAHASPTAFHQALLSDLDAPLTARRALDGFSGQVEEDVLERGALVVTEVVSNSVKHAGMTAAQRIHLSITLVSDRLRIEVTDQGAGFDPVAEKPDFRHAKGGWGLLLVDQLTDRWGVDFSHSTRVWCEFDVSLARGLRHRSAA